MFILFFAVLVFLFLRTLLFHLELWQKRDYRWDRLREHLFRTAEGRHKIWNLWFFKGFLVRPKFSGRILFILFFWFLLLTFLVFQVVPSILVVQNFYSIEVVVLFLFLVFERTLFLTVASAVLFSRVPADILKERLFQKAQTVIDAYQDQVIRIGITGSYGKSSTKEILVHLLIGKYGAENVLYNPRNENTEVGLAQLILRSRDFFERDSVLPKIIVFEIGAYGKGEIERVCQFFRPHMSLLTGVNNQHIPLFGSQRNIQEAKFELAENTKETVFFNAESSLLAEIFGDREIKATKVPISFQSVKNIQRHALSTDFHLYGIPFTLPWRGEFFVLNALLALEVSRELGLTPEFLQSRLMTLPPLERALRVEILPSGAHLLLDPYSANIDGVLSAVDELRHYSGKRIFVGIPLIELGNTTKESHVLLFQKLKEIQADVFWLKPDHSSLGRSLCGDHFHGSSVKEFQFITQELNENDGILFESRVPESFQSFLR